MRGAFGTNWFNVGGDIRLTERCTTEDCGGQVAYRLEASGVGSYYCSGCTAKIARSAVSGDETGDRYGDSPDGHVTSLGGSNT